MINKNLDQKLLLYIVPYTLKDEDKIHYGAVAAYGKNMAIIAVEKLVRGRNGKKVGSILTDEIMCVQQATDVAGYCYHLNLESTIIEKKRDLLKRIFRRN